MKLGHFPTPYPDELLYSVCARFSGRVEYSSSKSILYELFGAMTASAVIDLPNRISYLTESLPGGTSLTADRLIDENTLLPFYIPFMALERAECLREDVKKQGGSAAYLRTGIMASRIPLPRFLRFCPLCLNNDEKQCGEAYWHRLHQIAGVEVCHIHNVFLEDSEVSRNAGRKHLQFIPARDLTRPTSAQPLKFSSNYHLALLKIARDVEWLLKHPVYCTSLKALHNRYLSLLIKRGLATYTGSIHIGKLLDEFRSFYSPSFLKLLHCEFTGSDQVKTNWLLRLVRSPKHAQHPLYHLLLIQFLGYTVEEFFRIPDEISHFGEGPWPCLNPTANHYRQPIIQEYHLGDRLRLGKPTGRFSCKCGFAYARTGPDYSPEDRFHIGRIISFGQIWEAKLKELWKETSLSLSEVGRRLGVDPLTIRRHAARLKLSLSRSSRKTKPLNHKSQLKGQSISAKWEKKRKYCRSKWISALNHKREIALKAIRHKLPQEYAWLRQNDYHWLKKHSRRTQKNIPSTLSVDWKGRDAEYAVAVRGAASRLINEPSRPIQVTKTAIGRAIGAVTVLQQKLNKMPLTAQVLASMVETREQYAVRRVWWAADLYSQEYVLPREWQLVMRANVYSLKEASAVKCALEAAMNMLRSELSQDSARRAAS